MSVILVCPHDHENLTDLGSHFSCDHCTRRYEVEGGVVRFLEKNDEFYEGAYCNQTHFVPRGEKPWQIWPLWLINGGYAWIVRKNVPKDAVVVELGCAGGVRYFGSRYHMIGCDLSFASLQSLEFYESRIQVDAAACIALPDSSVDAVVSSYFWEHIPPEIKPNILKECIRILKPGGKLIFLYDVETDNPLIRRYKKKNFQVYKELFINGDGHYGYQWPSENINIFRSAGFSVLEHRGMEKTVFQAPSVYKKLAHFGNSKVYGILSRAGSSPWFYPYTLLMRLIDTVICPWLPEKWARIELIVAENTENGKVSALKRTSRTNQ